MRAQHQIALPLAAPLISATAPATTPALRPYQLAAVEAIRTEYSAGRRRVLLVMATGLGKTVVFAEVARLATARGRRVLVLAHRDELIRQAVEKLAAVGIVAGVEKAAERAGAAAVVVASVQTLRGARLEAWPADAFDLVVVDEAHHVVADSYRAILDRFGGAGGAHVLGVTATADRLDGQGLGQLFESVAYRYELRAAIADGWLAPVRVRRVKVAGLKLAAVRTTAGDLNAGDLAAQLLVEQNLHAVAAPLVELAGDRLTLAFAADVAHAEALAAVINRYRPGAARALAGTATAELRRSTLADFAAGRFQVLVNVALLTEGFDCPAIGCVAVARPTKSRALYAQMIGRGTRLHPGKADLLVLDFTGSAGRHRLVGPADVLAGTELAGAARAVLDELLAGDAEQDLEDALAGAEAAAADEAARADQQVTAVVQFLAEDVDPFLGELELPAASWARDPATAAQTVALARAGLEVPPGLSKGQAAAIMTALQQRRERGLATLKQVRLLERQGIDARAMSFQDASARIGQLATRWRSRRSDG